MLGGVLGLHASEEAAALGLAAGVARVAAGRGRLAARSGLTSRGARGRLFADRGGLANGSGLAARGGLFAADRSGLAAGRLTSRGTAAVLVAATEQTGLSLDASRQDDGHSNSESENVLHLWFLPASGLAAWRRSRGDTATAPLTTAVGVTQSDA